MFSGIFSHFWQTSPFHMPDLKVRHVVDPMRAGACAVNHMHAFAAAFNLPNRNSDFDRKD
jgi:uncharacterized protein YqiB (DUF1249 family)